MLLFPVELSMTPSSGAISTNTPRIYGQNVLVYIKPTTETTEWDFKLTDAKDRVIYHKIDEVGTFRDYVPFPVKGIYTARLENSSVDEAFTILMQIREDQ